jgi:hypothetical protein
MAVGWRYSRRAATSTGLPSQTIAEVVKIRGSHPMKIFPGTNPPIPPRHLRKKRRTEVPLSEVHQVVHSFLNQLSVINLCSFKLIASCGNNVTRGISNDLEMLQRAVQDASLIAEQLSQTLAESAPLVKPKRPRLIKSRPQANNVLRLFAGNSRQP